MSEKFNQKELEKATSEMKHLLAQKPVAQNIINNIIWGTSHFNPNNKK